MDANREFRLGERLLNFARNTPESEWGRNSLVSIKCADGCRRPAPRVVLKACCPKLQTLENLKLKVTFSAEVLDDILNFMFLDEPIHYESRSILEYLVAAEQLGFPTLCKQIKTKLRTLLASNLEVSELLNARATPRHLQALAEVLDHMSLRPAVSCQVEKEIHAWRLHNRGTCNVLAAWVVLKSVRKPRNTAFIVRRETADGSRVCILRNVLTQTDSACAIDVLSMDSQKTVVIGTTLLTVENRNLVQYDISTGQRLARSSGFSFSGVTVSDGDVYVYTEREICLAYSDANELSVNMILANPQPIQLLHLVERGLGKLTFVVQDTDQQISLVTWFSDERLETKVLFRKNRKLAGVNSGHIYLFHHTRETLELIDYFDSQVVRSYTVGPRIDLATWCVCGTSVYFEGTTEGPVRENTVIEVYDMVERKKIFHRFGRETRYCRITVLPGTM